MHNIKICYTQHLIIAWYEKKKPLKWAILIFTLNLHYICLQVKKKELEGVTLSLDDSPPKEKHTLIEVRRRKLGRNVH